MPEQKTVLPANVLSFPPDFLWGAATSAYQVEGDNRFCDWWEWEKARGLESSGSACMQYRDYESDFSLARELGHNAHRLSVEWSRIQPSEGSFSEKELAHYCSVIDSLVQKGIEPVITLHHFTNPIWFSRSGGWLNPESPEYFRRFTQEVVSRLAGKVKYWVTLNEPTVYVYFSYIYGSWPPGEKSLLLAKKVMNNLHKGHNLAYKQIHRIYKENGMGRPAVSIAHHMQAFEACGGKWKNRIAAFLRQKIGDEFLVQLIRAGTLDYIGVNYYTRFLVEVVGFAFKKAMMEACTLKHDRLEKNSLGWEIYPQGIYDVLLRLKKYGLEVMVLENGICTQTDWQRWEFIKQHLCYVHKAIADGVKVKGYFYWSLIDNFEWDKGFAPRFGLIGVDYTTMARQVRPSAQNYARVCKSSKLEV